MRHIFQHVLVIRHLTPSCMIPNTILCALPLYHKQRHSDNSRSLIPSCAMLNIVCAKSYSTAWANQTPGEVFAWFCIQLNLDTRWSLAPGSALNLSAQFRYRRSLESIYWAYIFISPPGFWPLVCT